MDLCENQNVSGGVKEMDKRLGGILINFVKSLIIDRLSLSPSLEHDTKTKPYVLTLRSCRERLHHKATQAHCSKQRTVYKGIGNNALFVTPVEDNF